MYNYRNAREALGNAANTLGAANGVQNLAAFITSLNTASNAVALLIEREGPKDDAASADAKERRTTVKAAVWSLALTALLEGKVDATDVPSALTGQPLHVEHEGVFTFLSSTAHDMLVLATSGEWAAATAVKVAEAALTASAPKPALDDVFQSIFGGEPDA